MLRCSFLGGLLLAIAANRVDLPSPLAVEGCGGLGAMRMPASLLLMMPEVRKELNVTDAQQTQMDAIRNEGDEGLSVGDVGFRLPTMRDMSQEERDKKIAEFADQRRGVEQED